MADKEKKRKILEFGEKSKAELLIEKLTLAAGIVLFLVSFIPQLTFAGYILGALGVVFSAYPGVEDMFEGFSKKRVNESTLMVVAVCAAMLTYQFKEAVAIAILYRILKWLQTLSKNRALRSMKSLDSQVSESAHLVLEAGGTESIDGDKIEKGMLLKVLPHETIPVECVITEGRTTVESLSDDGKSVPRIVSTGDGLYGGMTNGSATITVEALLDAADSQNKKIPDIIKRTAETKSSCEEKTAAVMRYFTAGVAVIAIAAAIIGSIITGNTGTWVNNAIVILTVSFGSSMAALIPGPFIISAVRGSEKGIVLRNAGALEKAASADTFAFDGAGMFTSGRLTAGDVFAVPGYSEEDILSLAAEYAKTADDESLTEIFDSSLDRGVSSDKEIFCGDEDKMKEKDIDVSPLPKSSFYVSADGALIGSIQVVKETAGDLKSLVKSLRDLGIKNTVLFSEKENDGADIICREAGIDKCITDVTDKKSALEKIRSGGHKVIYLSSDTDFPAKADVKVSYGTEAMPEKADVIITSSDTGLITDAVKLGRHTMRTVKFNTAFILLVKIAVTVFAFLSLAPVYSGILSEVASVIICIIFTAVSGRAKKSAHTK